MGWLVNAATKIEAGANKAKTWVKEHKFQAAAAGVAIVGGIAYGAHAYLQGKNGDTDQALPDGSYYDDEEENNLLDQYENEAMND